MQYRHNPIDTWRFNLLIKFFQKQCNNKNPFQSKTILNIGAGYGEESYLILSESPKFLILSDIEIGRLIYAQQYLNKFTNKYFVCCDAKALPFKERKIEIIFLREAMHHIWNSDKEIEALLEITSQALIIDDAKKGLVRNWLNSLFCILRVKQPYEIDNKKVLRYRGDLNKFNGIASKNNLKLFSYPYFIFFFDNWYNRVKYNFVGKLYLLFLVTINKIFHRFGNRVIFIFKRT